MSDIDYKSIVLKQRAKSLAYYHENKTKSMMDGRNNKQREFYNDQKDYYKIYNRYRRAKKLEKVDEFINKYPLDYNMLINSGRVRALKGAVEVQVVGSHSEKMEE
jgi:hypothetical protein|tara:strand:- start:19 stop:333 length:315 start_codon:yes stop_codon:yes gene_type:complete